MVKLTFVEPSGAQRTVEAQPGISIMRAAKANGVAGIVAQCGGACMCATCHIKLNDFWLAKCGPKTMAETEMLPFAIDVTTNSRLSCQITITQELDGVVILLPETQL